MLRLNPGEKYDPTCEPDLKDLVTEHSIEAAKDTVLVAPFADGGLISYRRNDGSVLHTLNTSEGFARKLADLGIPLPTGERSTK